MYADVSLSIAKSGAAAALRQLRDVGQAVAVTGSFAASRITPVAASRSSTHGMSPPAASVAGWGIEMAVRSLREAVPADRIEAISVAYVRELVTTAAGR